MPKLNLTPDQSSNLDNCLMSFYKNIKDIKSLSLKRNDDGLWAVEVDNMVNDENMKRKTPILE